MSNRKSKSRDVQVILHKLEREPDYATSIAPRLVIEHLAGDYNGPSDRASRALWSDLLEMCYVLNVKPIMVELNEREKRFIMEVIRSVAESKGTEVTTAEMAPQVPPASIDCIGVSGRGGRPSGPGSPCMSRLICP